MITKIAKNIKKLTIVSVESYFLTFYVHLCFYINLKEYMKKVGYYLMIIFLYPIALLPSCCLNILSDFIFFIICYVVGYRKQIVLRNLENAFPKKNKAEIKILAKKFYKSFADILIEYLMYWTMSSKQLKQHVKIKNTTLFEKYKNRHIVFIIGHFNNWEWYNILPAYTMHNILGLVKPIKNNNVEKLITKIRSRHGMDVVLIKNTLREILQREKNNIPSLSIFAGDQIPTANEINFWTTFLNQETPVYLGAEKIAKKINAVVIYADMFRIKRHYYEINLQLITDLPQKEPPYHITLKHITALETSILKQPESWLWSHRRWKHKRKTNEKIWKRLPS